MHMDGSTVFARWSEYAIYHKCVSLGPPKSKSQTTSRSVQPFLTDLLYKNSSGDEIANVNFFYKIAHVQASAYAH